MRELAQTLVQEMMAEKEAEIRLELTERQAKIEELQRRLVESEKRAKQGELSLEEKRQREALQRQIAAEEEAREKREAELEAERLRAEEEARQQARAHQTATAVAVEEADAATVAASPTIPPAVPTTAPTPAPPAVPSPVPTTVAADSGSVAALEFDSFFEPSEVDTLPVAIKVFSADWPLTAQRSRRKGVIIMQATVNADGLVDEVKILRADEEGFGIPEAAIAAAQKYRFKPGTKDGVPVRTYATITQAFRFANSR